MDGYTRFYLSTDFQDAKIKDYDLRRLPIIFVRNFSNRYEEAAFRYPWNNIANPDHPARHLEVVYKENEGN